MEQCCDAAMGKGQGDDGNHGIQGATCMSGDAKCGIRVQGKGLCAVLFTNSSLVT